MSVVFTRRPLLNADMRLYLQGLITASPSLSEIWLFGSRANLVQRADSDWDFLAHGTANCVNEIKATPSLHRQDVDFLVSTDRENFVNAWGSKDKSLDFTMLQWNQLSEDAAEYVGTKDGGEGFAVIRTQRMAFRIWIRG